MIDGTVLSHRIDGLPSAEDLGAKFRDVTAGQARYAAIPQLVLRMTTSNELNQLLNALPAA